MKKNNRTAHRLLCALLALLMLSLFVSCRDAAPVGLDVSSDGGAGRDTSPSVPSVSDTTAEQTNAPPETDAPETDPPETEFVYPSFSDDGIITICLDAGHGFDDIGTDSAYLGDKTEKDITLPIVLMLKDKLEAVGFSVILTHDGTSFPKSAMDNGDNLFNPKERISYAYTLNIDYFLSIHCDSYTADSGVKGTRVYYSMGTPYESASASAAKKLAEGINSALPDSKKSVVKNMEYSAAYYVIRMAHTPSSLIEIGFVTNPTDAANMLSEAWRESFTDGIVSGLTDYFT